MNCFKIRLCLATLVFLIGSMSQAAVIGMLYAGPETNVSFGVQKSGGDLYFLMDIDNNPRKVEFVFSPGNPFNPATVIEVNGKPMVSLSVYDGTKYGFENSKNVTIQPDSTVDRTSQKTRFSADLVTLENQGQLRDAGGKSYSLAELKGVVFVYQVPAGMETTLDAKEFYFDTLKDGEVKQLLGETELRAIEGKGTVGTYKIGDVVEVQANNTEEARKQLPKPPAGTEWVYKYTIEVIPGIDVFELKETEGAAKKGASLEVLERYANEVKSIAIQELPYQLALENVKEYVRTQLPFEVAEARITALSELLIKYDANVLELLAHEQAKSTGKLEINFDKGVRPFLVDRVAEQMKTRTGEVSVDSAVRKGKK